jgi:NADPH2:quinone reductase
VLEYRELPTPEPSPDEVSIDVAYAGVGMVDSLFRDGSIPLELPFIPGIEATGSVRAVGRNVVDLKPGDRVAVLLNDFGRVQRVGGYAEVAVAHQDMTARVPEGADLVATTAALANGVTAWIALHALAKVTSEDTVVVLGASGGLGATAVRVAAAIPARRVVAVVGRDVSRAPAEAGEVVLADDFATWLDAQGDSIDVVVDPVGGTLRAEAFRHLAPFGRHLVLGDASGNDVEISSDAAWLATRSLIGFSLGAVAHRAPQLVRSAMDDVIGLVASGVLVEPDPEVVPLSDVVSVHERIVSRRAPAKTLLAVAR